jgi:2-aminoadipate transaminase
MRVIVNREGTQMIEEGLPWQRLFERSGKSLTGSDIRDLLEVTARPEVISFAGGLPAPELFPAAALRDAYSAVLTEDGGGALQYGPTEGHLPLRELIASRMRRRGVDCGAEQVLITSGSQQGLDLIAKVFAGPGLRVLVEAPGYVGALQAFSLQQAALTPFPMDEDGLRVDTVAVWLAEHGSGAAALLYTIPTFQNPSGATLAMGRRLALIELCRRYELPLVEDDPYSELYYGASPTPPLRSLPGGEETLYLGTFSKILAPGLRLGWVVAPTPVVRQLVIAKQGTDLHTDSLSQRAVVRLTRHFDLDAHIVRLRAVYRERRDAMLDALRREMPPGVDWTEPQGGMFIWLTLPDGVDARTLLAEAARHRVVYVPGAAFHVDGAGGGALRLNFTNSTIEAIRTGVEYLGIVLRDTLDDRTRGVDG